MPKSTRLVPILFLAAPIVVSAALADQLYPTCMPVDEGPRRPDFVAFRTQLKMIIERRDAAALLRIVHPQVRSGFGGEDDLDAFVQWWHPENPKSELWKELGFVINLGGKFVLRDDRFEAPYVASCSPPGYGPFDYVALVGSNVRVRATPQSQARVLAILSYAVLALNQSDYNGEAWTSVKLADGRAGFVKSEFARSPTGYRAYFSFIDGEWRLTMFLAGD